MPRNLGFTAALALLLVPFAGAHALRPTKVPISPASLVQHAGFDRCSAWRDKCAWRWAMAHGAISVACVATDAELSWGWRSDVAGLSLWVKPCTGIF